MNACTSLTFHALLNAHVFTCESRCSLRCACMNTSRMCSHAPFVTATQVSAIRENPHPATCLCGMLFLLMCTCGACGARCGCTDHADRVHAGKAAKSWCLQTERAPGSVSSICNHFITGAAHGHSSSRERLHFASSFSTYLLRELLHCHRSFQTRHCPVHRRCPRGAESAPDPACGLFPLSTPWCIGCLRARGCLAKAGTGSGRREHSQCGSPRSGI